MECKKCGKKLREGQTVCPKCGAQQTNEPKMVSLSQMSRQQKKKKPALTRKQLATRIAVVVVAALAALALVAVSIVYIYLGTHIQQTSELSGDIGINSELPTDGVKNIALFGLDTRRDNDSGRSDAMIILSIDYTHKKIKMTSLARDTLVPIDGHGKSKLTHAWAFGKAKLAVKTINQNFGMNISDYVYVNFFEFAEIIDYVGGVSIDVSASEMQVMNTHYVSYIQSYGIKCPRITKTGMQRLNGGQALAYARNRYTGSDIQRGDRQKEVLEAMFNEVKTLPVSKFPSLVSKILSMCHTNLTSSEMLSLASWAMTAQPTFERYSLPNPELKPWGGSSASYGWVYIYDMNLATALLHDFIYETDTDLNTVSRQSTNPRDTSRYQAATTTKKPTTSKTGGGTTPTSGILTDPTSSAEGTTSPDGILGEDTTSTLGGDSTTSGDAAGSTTPTNGGETSASVPADGTTASTSDAGNADLTE